MSVLSLACSSSILGEPQYNESPTSNPDIPKKENLSKKKNLELFVISEFYSASQCGAAGRAYDSGSRGPGFETRLSHLVFPLGKEINRQLSSGRFAGSKSQGVGR